MKKLTELEIINGLKHNPLYDTLISSKISKYKITNSLEREYILDRPANCTNYFKQKPGDKQLFQRVDNVEILSLHEDYTYVFGPYIDSNEIEASYVLVLFCQVDRFLYLKILYLDRFLKKEVVNKECVRVNYTPYKFTEQERQQVSKLYPDLSWGPSVYLLHGIRPWAEISTSDGNKRTCSLITLLYEIHVLKRRLTVYERVKPINGRFTDVRLENLTLTNSIKEALEDYRLDVAKLLELYTPFGYDRFRGIYHLPNIRNKPGRRLVVLYNSVTGVDHKLLFSRARKIVELGRLLDQTAETVDHIDRNYLNDNLSNLQVLPIKEHLNLDRIRVEYEEVTCTVCGCGYAISMSSVKLVKRGVTVYNRCPDCRRNKTVRSKGLPLTMEEIRGRYYLIDKSDQGRRIYLKSRTYMEAFSECHDFVKIVPIVD